MKIVALLPCLNEDASIAQTISELRKVLPSVDVVVIDNGSIDFTVERANQAGASVIHEPRKGKGFAIHTGFNAVPDEALAVFMVDGDATYGFENLIPAIELVTKSGFDMVIGKRQSTPNDNGEKSYRRGHKFGNWILTLVYRRLFGIKLTDTLSGWRVMSMPFVKSFPGSASSFEIEAELNVHAYNLNSAVTEVRASYKERIQGSSSKLNTYKDGWLILKRNISLYKSERPSIAYKLIGLPWFISSLILISFPISDYLKTGAVARFPSLIAGVGAFVISTNLWVTGMILERVRLNRVTQLKFRYSDFQKELTFSQRK